MEINTSVVYVCFETHIHSHMKVKSLLVQFKKEQEIYIYRLKFKILGNFITKIEHFIWEM